MFIVSGSGVEAHRQNPVQPETVHFSHPGGFRRLLQNQFLIQYK